MHLFLTATEQREGGLSLAVLCNLFRHQGQSRSYG